MKFDEAGSYQVVWDIKLDEEKRKQIVDLEMQLKKVKISFQTTIIKELSRERASICRDWQLVSKVLTANPTIEQLLCFG